MMIRPWDKDADGKRVAIVLRVVSTRRWHGRVVVALELETIGETTGQIHAFTTELEAGDVFTITDDGEPLGR